jgi:hypothetical protein
MTERIKLVQGDSRPQLVLSLTDEKSGGSIDISTATVRLRFREAETTTILFTLVADKIPGKVNTDGTIDFTGPYALNGKGGRCVINWTADALDQLPGNYEGEIEITFDDTSIQTVYDVLKFKLREQF